MVIRRHTSQLQDVRRVLTYVGRVADRGGLDPFTGGPKRIVRLLRTKYKHAKKIFSKISRDIFQRHYVSQPESELTHGAPECSGRPGSG